jgi:hypothetical protein
VLRSLKKPISRFATRQIAAHCTELGGTSHHCVTVPAIEFAAPTEPLSKPFDDLKVVRKVERLGVSNL